MARAFEGAFLAGLRARAGRVEETPRLAKPGVPPRPPRTLDRLHESQGPARCPDGDSFVPRPLAGRFALVLSSCPSCSPLSALPGWARGLHA